jgi:hypothetical protein
MHRMKNYRKTEGVFVTSNVKTQRRTLAGALWALVRMTPPRDSRLDTDGAGIDVPLPPRPQQGVDWPIVVFVATLLGLVSSALAWQFTISLGRPPGAWRSLLILNCTYWYVWALFTPIIVWLSQRFRLERQGLLQAVLVHAPSVAIFSLGHIAAMEGVRWWLITSEGRYFNWWVQVRRSALQNFDWEMMTYWAIVGVSHAVLYYRESRERALRTAQLETKLVEAHLQRLQQQLHPHFLFNTLHAISTLMHRDVEEADRTLMRLSDLLRLTLDNLGQQEGGARLPREVPPDRADAVHRPARRPLRSAAGGARRTGAEHVAATARRECDQARHRAQVGPRAHRHHGQARGGQALDGGPRRRRGPDGDGARRTAEGDRRVDDPREAPASLRGGLPLRVSSAAGGAGGRRGHSVARSGGTVRNHRGCRS